MFVDDQIVVPIDLRRRMLDILHSDHSGKTKMETEAKIFWCPQKKSDIETKVKNCTVCIGSAKNLKNRLPRKHYGNLEKVIKTRQKIHIIFTGKLLNKISTEMCKHYLPWTDLANGQPKKFAKLRKEKKLYQFLTSNFNLYKIQRKNPI